MGVTRFAGLSMAGAQRGEGDGLATDLRKSILRHIMFPFVASAWAVASRLPL